MPWKKLPINQPVYSNIDPVSLSNKTPERHNTYRNEAGAIVKRPGYVEYEDTGTKNSIDGIYNWFNQGLLIVVSNGNVYKKSQRTSFTGLTTLGTGLFELGVRVIFANFGDTLYAANGGDIIKIITTSASALTDPDIPTNVTHVAFFDTYLLANKGDTGEMHFSDVGAPETWSGNYITAEQSPDDLIAIHSRWAEIGLFGSEMIEMWYNDGETPFVPRNAVISIGCLAPYTIQWIRGFFYWLNENREIVRSTGQSYDVLSDPIRQTLREPKEISNAIADHVTVKNEDWYVLTLPNYGDNGLTLVFDLRKNEWQGTWSSWDPNDSTQKRFRGNCYLYVPDWNLHILGDHFNGKLYSMKSDVQTDAGEILKASWLTGNIDHDTELRKRSYKIRFRVLRGEGGNTTPVLMLRWRDDGNKAWSNTKYIDLGKTGETDFFVSLRRLGMYRSRQYELSLTDDVPIAIADAEELVEIISHA